MCENTMEEVDIRIQRTLRLRHWSQDLLSLGACIVCCVDRSRGSGLEGLEVTRCIACAMSKHTMQNGLCLHNGGSGL